MKVEIEIFPFALVRRSGIGDTDAPLLLTECPVPPESANDPGRANTSYESRIQLEKRELLGLLDNQGFAKSLAHSNLDLIHRLRNHLDAPPPQNKRQRRKQLLSRRTAARYATRAATKTSPFGYFGTVGLRPFSKESRNLAIRPITIARLNVEVIIHFLRLADPLLLKSGAVDLEIVPSAYVKGGWLYFYAVIDGKPMIRRLRWSRALENLIELLPPVEEADGSLSDIRLVRIRDTDRVSDEVIEKLRNMGLLVLRAPCSLLDGRGGSGLECLIQIHEALGSKRVHSDCGSIQRIQNAIAGTGSRSIQLYKIQRELLQMEAELRRMIGVSAVSGEVSRSGVRRRFFQKNLNFAEASQRELEEGSSSGSTPIDRDLHAEVQTGRKKEDFELPVATENLIYEDVSVGQCDGPPDRYYEEVARKTAPFVQLLHVLKQDLELGSPLFRTFRDSLTTFVPIMEAYQSWLKHEADADEGPDVLGGVDCLLRRAVVISSADDYRVQLSVDAGAVLGSESAISFDFSLVGQWSRCGDASRFEFVVNHFLPGCARYLSRFLPLFPEKLTREIIQWRANRTAGSVEAEIVDSDIYSANVHPALTRYQIMVNPACGDFECAKPIAVADLAVRFCQTRKAFEFKSLSTGLLVSPVDFGFMGIAKRRGLTQFLLRLAAQGGYPESEVLGVLRNAFVKQISEGVSFIPRIGLSDGLTISRARWIILDTNLLLKRKREGSSTHYNRIRHLLRDHSIPMLVYVTEYERIGSEFGHKPQFVNVASPTGLELLASVVRKAEGRGIVLEEAFPTGRSSYDKEGVRSEDYFGARASIIE